KDRREMDTPAGWEKRVQWADGFVLVYSICDRASFNVLHPKVQVIKAAKEALSQEKVPIVIVGNKRDLHHQRAVSSEEGRLLALSMDCEFYEVSAAEAYHGALMVFQGLAERICEAKLALKKGTGIRSIVKSMSATNPSQSSDCEKSHVVYWGSQMDSPSLTPESLKKMAESAPAHIYTSATWGLYNSTRRSPYCPTPGGWALLHSY
uniref:small monomeric GTPase n=1 Tax=Chelonoidis abingdonii TaxID=106734 RepID=A0A8C0FZH1_CHEAB